MNITLSVLNAAALVALVAFHFSDNTDERNQVAAQQQPHHLLRQAPQLAVMTQQAEMSTILANDAGTTTLQAVDRSERWVF